MRTVTVWIHGVAAAVWLGSMVFLVIAVMPVLRRPEYQAIYGDMLHRISLRLRWLGWISLVVLAITGIGSLAHLGYTWSDLVTGRLWEGSFGRALAWKVGLVGGIVILNLLHDVWIGPRVTALVRHQADDPHIERYRRIAAWLGRGVLILTLIVFYLAMALIRGGI